MNTSRPSGMDCRWGREGGGAGANRAGMCTEGQMQETGVQSAAKTRYAGGHPGGLPHHLQHALPAALLPHCRQLPVATPASPPAPPPPPRARWRPGTPARSGCATWPGRGEGVGVCTEEGGCEPCTSAALPAKPPSRRPQTAASRSGQRCALHQTHAEGRAAGAGAHHARPHLRGEGEARRGAARDGGVGRSAASTGSASCGTAQRSSNSKGSCRQAQERTWRRMSTTCGASSVMPNGVPSCGVGGGR